MLPSAPVCVCAGEAPRTLKMRMVVDRAQYSHREFGTCCLQHRARESLSWNNFRNSNSVHSTIFASINIPSKSRCTSVHTANSCILRNNYHQYTYQKQSTTRRFGWYMALYLRPIDLFSDGLSSNILRFTKYYCFGGFQSAVQRLVSSPPPRLFHSWAFAKLGSSSH